MNRWAVLGSISCDTSHPQLETASDGDTEDEATEDRDAAAEPMGPGLPAEGRQRLAAALAESSDALAGDDPEQLTRALTALADAARELAAVLERTVE